MNYFSHFEIEVLKIKLLYSKKFYVLSKFMWVESVQTWSGSLPETHYAGNLIGTQSLQNCEQ